MTALSLSCFEHQKLCATYTLSLIIVKVFKRTFYCKIYSYYFATSGDFWEKKCMYKLCHTHVHEWFQRNHKRKGFRVYSTTQQSVTSRRTDTTTKNLLQAFASGIGVLSNYFTLSFFVGVWIKAPFYNELWSCSLSSCNSRVFINSVFIRWIYEIKKIHQRFYLINLLEIFHEKSARIIFVMNYNLH